MTDASPTEIAWAAGFFDGEGSTCVNRQRGGRKYLHLQLGQKDPRALVRFLAAVEDGKLYETKTFHKYAAFGEKALAALERLWPYLGDAKKEQARLVLDELGLTVGH